MGSLLLQQEIDKVSAKYDSNRKLQVFIFYLNIFFFLLLVSSLARATKIRTYNFKEHRVTDHRIKHSINNLDDFLKGGESLDEMIALLQELYVMQTLEEEQEEKQKAAKT